MTKNDHTLYLTYPVTSHSRRFDFHFGPLFKIRSICCVFGDLMCHLLINYLEKSAFFLNKPSKLILQFFGVKNLNFHILSYCAYIYI